MSDAVPFRHTFIDCPNRAELYRKTQSMPHEDGAAKLQRQLAVCVIKPHSPSPARPVDPPIASLGLPLFDVPSRAPSIAPSLGSNNGVSVHASYMEQLAGAFSSPSIKVFPAPCNASNVYTNDIINKLELDPNNLKYTNSVPQPCLRGGIPRRVSEADTLGTKPLQYTPLSPISHWDSQRLWCDTPESRLRISSFCSPRNEPLESPNSIATLTKELIDLIPRSIDGNLLSVGSILHDLQQCRACAFFRKGTCVNGVKCMFCHEPHQNNRRHKYRKSKNKQSGNGDDDRPQTPASS
eukprot:GHVL01004715.1.p1 GENE.GHVL01004715.1~~GHVL01004715.1.p1  ORF type:complete len:295 (+),score=28.82 GHVL01004715.1:596-1480(+)